MNRKNKIYIGASLVSLGGVFLIVNSISKKKLFNKILNAIGGSALNINNYDEWFNPNFFNKYTNGNYILLTEGNVLQKTNKLKGAFGYFSNDNEDILSVIRSIPDGVALSQISSKFESKGFGDLRTKIGNLDKSSMNLIGSLLSDKPAYRQS
jgi:hypothetical protein